MLLEIEGAAAATSYDVLIGNREWMNRNGLDVTPDIDKAMEEQEVQGQTAVLCVIDGVYLSHVTPIFLCGGKGLVEIFPFCPISGPFLSFSWLLWFLGRFPSILISVTALKFPLFLEHDRTIPTFSFPFASSKISSFLRCSNRKKENNTCPPLCPSHHPHLCSHHRRFMSP